MHGTCLHCTRSLGRNDVLETLPIGRRLAFDAAQGRLWVVCPHCAKWNLVPFDTRLESIDAAERLFRDTRTRFSTDNIGLARVREGLELVRIGPALRPEFAAWRYGEQYRKRRRRAIGAGVVGAGVVGAGIVGLGTAGVALGSFGYLTYRALQAGWEFQVHRMARLMVEHPGTRRPWTLRWDSVKHAVISWETDAPMLELPLYGPTKDDALCWSGADFRQHGRRALGSHNLLAGKAQELEHATALLAEHGGHFEEWLRWRTDRAARFGPMNFEGRDGWPGSTQRPYLPIAKLAPDERLAVEMWMNEDVERTWLAGELTLLEREWQEAERLAKIADGLVFEAEGVAPSPPDSVIPSEGA
ncbi:MAG: hypothetical protein AB7N73_09950 [Gemmatimonadales bacterium]